MRAMRIANYKFNPNSSDGFVAFCLTYKRMNAVLAGDDLIFSHYMTASPEKQEVLDKALVDINEPQNAEVKKLLVDIGRSVFMKSDRFIEIADKLLQLYTKNKKAFNNFAKMNDKFKYAEHDNSNVNLDNLVDIATNYDDKVFEYLLNQSPDITTFINLSKTFNNGHNPVLNVLIRKGVDGLLNLVPLAEDTMGRLNDPESHALLNRQLDKPEVKYDPSDLKAIASLLDSDRLRTQDEIGGILFNIAKLIHLLEEYRIACDKNETNHIDYLTHIMDTIADIRDKANLVDSNIDIRQLIKNHFGNHHDNVFAALMHSVAYSSEQNKPYINLLMHAVTKIKSDTFNHPDLASDEKKSINDCLADCLRCFTQPNNKRAVRQAYGDLKFVAQELTRKRYWAKFMKGFFGLFANISSKAKDKKTYYETSISLFNKPLGELGSAQKQFKALIKNNKKRKS